MKRGRILLSAATALCVWGGAASAGQPAPGGAALPEKPNFIVLFADDLGYGDLGCYGHPTIRTPNLDRMAAEGMRFTQFYAAASVCTPSRAGLITGRYPIRSGMCSSRRRVIFPDSKGGLPDSETTIAEVLKKAGYRTACVGKWHLGHLPRYLPTRHGFDYYFGLPYSNDMDRDPKAPRGRAAFLRPKSEYWRVPLMRNETILRRGPDQSQLTRRYTEEALRFIRENRERPFFLYLPYTFPHVPLFASDRFLGKSRRGLYGDAVEELDWSVGQILDELRKLGLARKTLVFFSSDNGPWLVQLEQGGSAGLLSGGKGSTWEGGMREPGIAWWPGVIRPGSVCREVACTMDFLPTFARLAGGRAPQDRLLDGRDIAPLLLGRKLSSPRVFFYYRGAKLFAARKGAFKLHLFTQRGYGQPRPERHEPPLLFNLDQDPSEKYNVAARYPDVAADILREIERHRATIKPVPSQLEIH
ncbi:MAG: sulfatase [Verrucomicrobia bacterium]|nr:sulfatase [Verrucomicrobiota bacterium]